MELDLLSGPRSDPIYHMGTHTLRDNINSSRLSNTADLYGSEG
jgi:hypothetical protein